MMRNQQIHEMKTTNLSIKCDIVESARAVNSVTASALQAIRNISCQSMSRLTEFEDRIRHVEVIVENRNTMTPPRPPICVPFPAGYNRPYVATQMPRVVPTVNTNDCRTPPTTSVTISQVQPSAARPVVDRVCDDEEFPPLSVSAMQLPVSRADPTGCFPATQTVGALPPENSTHNETRNPSAARRLPVSRPDAASYFVPDETVPSCYSQTDTTRSAPQPPLYNVQDFTGPGSGRPVQTPAVDRRGSSIPARISTRTCESGDGDMWCNEEFRLVESRRVERFCLLGLSSSINTSLLTEEVESYGPSVKSVRVFPLRRDRGRVLVKLTLFANESAALVLADDFWPAYVRCKPWRPRETRTQRPPTADGHSGSRHDDERFTARGTVSEGYANHQRRAEVPPRFKRAAHVQNYGQREKESYRPYYKLLTCNRYDGIACDVD